MEDQRRQCVGELLPRTTPWEDQARPFPRRLFDANHQLSLRPDTNQLTPTDNFLSLESAFSNLNISNLNPHQLGYQGGVFNGSGLAQDPAFLNDHVNGGLWKQLDQERNMLYHATSGFRDARSYPPAHDLFDIVGGIGWYAEEPAPPVRTGSTRIGRDRMGSSQRAPLWVGPGLSLRDLRGRLLGLAKDQFGCRLLQSALGGLTREQVDVIFQEVIDYVDELMVDPFGNYVIQKLVEVCREEQRTRILLGITKKEFQLVSICLNLHGTRAVQKLLSHITTVEQVSLVMSSLRHGVVAMTKDVNGHHVIQHCLKHFSAEDNKYLLTEVADNCFSISTDKSGCCVMQLCVQYAQGEIRDLLVSEIIAHALLLAEDRYGNYVVQHIVGLKVPHITTSLLTHLQGSFAALSCNKYGSNVVEKCLSESTEDQSSQIILELVTSANASLLLLDPYGNYVIQCALSVSKGQTHVLLLELVKKNIHMLRSNIYGKKVLAWFEKRRNLYM